VTHVASGRAAPASASDSCKAAPYVRCHAYAPGMTDFHHVWVLGADIELIRADRIISVYVKRFDDADEEPLTLRRLAYSTTRSECARRSSAAARARHARLICSRAT
jgi:hypothetical protein